MHIRLVDLPDTVHPNDSISYSKLNKCTVDCWQMVERNGDFVNYEKMQLINTSVEASFERRDRTLVWEVECEKEF